MGIALQALLDRKRQALHAAPRDLNPDTARDRDHRRLRSSRIRCSGSPSPSRSTRTRQPPPISISTMPAPRGAGDGAVGCRALIETGAAAEAISTGTRAGTVSPLSAPWRVCRRERLACGQPVTPRRHRYQPWAAIALGNDPLLFFHQRRRAPADTTANRETFEIGVWSVVRPSLHPPSHQARRPSPER